MLAHDCTLLEIGYNFDRLYGGNDADYEFALGVVRDRVNSTHQERNDRQAAREKAG
jgi:hypothetical protein